MRNRGYWLSLILAAALAAGGSGCRKADPRGAQDQNSVKEGGAGNQDSRNGGIARQEYAAPVAIATLERRAICEFANTVGTVAPARSRAVKAEESGRIRFIQEWKEGDFVKEGEILARLDEAETSRAIEIAQSDLDTQRNRLTQALARVERTSADFDRAKIMYDLGQISRKAYEEREYQCQTAKISYEESVIAVERAEKSLDKFQLENQRKVVRAPMSGYLVTRGAVENRGNLTAADSAETVTYFDGRLVGTGSTICGVVDTSSLLIRCDVTSKDIGKIVRGQKARANVYSDHGIAVEGEVMDISPIMDVQTHAFKVDVAVPNSENRLRPGMFARVDIIINMHRDALAVERKVLQRRNNQDLVFVVNDEGRAEKRVVQIGLENPDEVEILEGLRAGDRLITLGYETLQDKIKVKIIEMEPTVADEKETTSSAAGS